MGAVFGRRTNIIVVFIAGAIFFMALGFFLATGIDQPPGTRAEQLWTDGTNGGAPTGGPDFAPVAEKMRPTVVHILVTGRSTDTSTSDTFPQDHPQIPPDFEQQSEGSGVIISSDGYILTNRHVVDGADKVVVTLTDSERYDATVVGSDARDDLALLKVEPEGTLLVAPLGDSDTMRIGDWVMAMGNPLGFEYSVTVGVVSGKGRELPSSNFGDFIQTDAAIYPGNSGGPLFNLAGEVIGINTAVIPDTNLGFAVPINTAKEILPQLLEKGAVTRGYLGVRIQAVDFLAEKPAGVEEGAVVMEVHEGAPAHEAGIEVGDVIVTFDGKPVDSPGTLTDLVVATSPGSRVPVTVVRDGQPRNIEVVIGVLPSSLE